MRNHTPQRGYTLLEMVVSVGIFAIVMLAATGAYLSLIKLDRHARAVNEVANNLSFAVDSMARSIRTGTSYFCTPGDSQGNNTLGTCTQFTFHDADNPARRVRYRLVNGQIMAAYCTPAQSCTFGSDIPLTSPRITVTALEFRVRGVGTGDGVQPQVTFNVRGTAPVSATEVTSFSIQGSATQRLLEL